MATAPSSLAISTLPLQIPLLYLNSIVQNHVTHTPASQGSHCPQNKSHSTYHSLQGSSMIWSLPSPPPQRSLPCSYTQYILRCPEFPAYTMLFLIHMPLCTASPPPRRSSISSPTESLINSYSTIKILSWEHLPKKAFHVHDQPSPQARVCALTFSLYNTHKGGHHL